MEKLNKESQPIFNIIWENCSDLGVYIQRKFGKESLKSQLEIGAKNEDKFEDAAQKILAITFLISL
jgi:hypothetical protein